MKEIYAVVSEGKFEQKSRGKITIFFQDIVYFTSKCTEVLLVSHENSTDYFGLPAAKYGLKKCLRKESRRNHTVFSAREKLFRRNYFFALISNKSRRRQALRQS